MQKKIIFMILLALLAMFAFIYCGNAKTEQLNESLKANTWVLIKFMGKKPLKGTRLTIAFRDDKAHGSGGCNSYSADYAIDENKIHIESLMITEMACHSPKGILNQESRYVKALSNVTHFRLSKKKLILRNNQGVELVYRPKKKEKDRSLRETNWQLSSFAAKGLAFSTVRESKITAKFSKNSIKGSTGCNAYKAKYKVKADSLSISKIKVSKKKCANSSFQEQEQTFIDMFKNVHHFKIKGSSLILFSKGGKRLYFHAKNIVKKST